jgi:hypothetical protein
MFFRPHTLARLVSSMRGCRRPNTSIEATLQFGKTSITLARSAQIDSTAARTCGSMRDSKVELVLPRAVMDLGSSFVVMSWIASLDSLSKAHPVHARRTASLDFNAFIGIWACTSAMCLNPRA